MIETAASRKKWEQSIIDQANQGKVVKSKAKQKPKKFTAKERRRMIQRGRWGGHHFSDRQPRRKEKHEAR